MKSRRTVDSLTSRSAATSATLRRLVVVSSESTWSQRALRPLAAQRGAWDGLEGVEAEGRGPVSRMVTQTVLRALRPIAPVARRIDHIPSDRRVTFESR